MNNVVIQCAAMRICIAVLLLTTLMGCVKRTLTITSTPPNALVWLNDREIGRTPLHIDFLYYGEYDVRILHDEGESILTSRWIHAPWWDAPFVDMVAELSPFDITATPAWHFDLQPRNDNPIQLIERANSFRNRESGVQK